MSSITAGTTSTTTLVHSGDTTGSLVFKTNDTGSGGTTAVTIDTSQNVGIGTSSPSQKLDVVGTARVANTTGNKYLLVGQSTPSGNDGVSLEFQNSNTQKNWAIRSNFNVGGGLEFCPSSSAGGTSYTTPSVVIDSSGNLLVGTTSATAGAVFKVTGTTASSISHQVWTTASSTNAAYWTEGGNSVNGVATGASATASMIRINKDSGSTRSISAAGTINASGADYAEYMTKSGNFTVAKGDVIGINSEGKLTNVFADAVSFVVKSTDPSYVGGDTWGSEDKIGNSPLPDASQEEQEAFKAALEAARQKVDRIAFAGQVPVNVLGANAGQYIIPVNDNGAIKGEAVSNPTFEQYQIAVGKVIAIESDGRAKIIVKVA